MEKIEIELYNHSEMILNNNVRYHFNIEFTTKEEFLEKYNKDSKFLVKLRKLDDIIRTHKMVNIICENKKGVSLVINFLKHRNKW